MLLLCHSCERSVYILISLLSASLFATIGSFGLGTVLSWSAPALPQMSAPCPQLTAITTNESSVFSQDWHSSTNGSSESILSNCLELSKEEQTWVASLLNFGAFTAGPLAGLLMPRYGKKWTMMILSIPILIGWMFLILATSVYHLYVGRFLTGFSGAFSMLAPGFISEICQVDIRGSLASSMQVMTMFGLLSVYTIGAFLSWRYVSIICSMVPFMTIICLYFIPRSPSFLMSKGAKLEAMSSLQYYRGYNYDVTAEIQALDKSIVESQYQNRTGLWTVLTTKKYYHPLLLSVMLMLLQQFSGIKVIQSYIFQIFQNAGSKFDANVCAIVVGVIQVTGTSISVLVVDKFGRRKLLILSEVFISISFCMLGSFFFIQEYYSSITYDLAWLPLASIVTFAVAYSMGMGPLPWVLNAELFSKESKATSSSLCASFNWFCSFMVVKFSPTLETLIGASGSYLSFSLLAILGTVLISVLVPETKGKTEEEIQKYFHHSPSQSSLDMEMQSKFIEESDLVNSASYASFSSSSIQRVLDK